MLSASPGERGEVSDRGRGHGEVELLLSVAGLVPVPPAKMTSRCGLRRWEQISRFRAVVTIHDLVGESVAFVGLVRFRRRGGIRSVAWGAR